MPVKFPSSHSISLRLSICCTNPHHHARIGLSPLPCLQRMLVLALLLRPLSTAALARVASIFASNASGRTSGALCTILVG